MSAPPLVVVIPGPNGAGKSTTAPRLPQALAPSECVDADAIAPGLSAVRRCPTMASSRGDATESPPPEVRS